MLAEQGRGGLQLEAAAVEEEGGSRVGEASGLGVLRLDEVAPRLQVWVVEGVHRRVDRRARDPVLLGLFHRLLLAVLGQPGEEVEVELVLDFGPGEDHRVLEAGLVLELGLAEQVDVTRPAGRWGHRHADIAVRAGVEADGKGGGEHDVADGHVAGVLVADEGRHAAVGAAHGDLGDGKVDGLAGAGAALVHRRRHNRRRGAGAGLSLHQQVGGLERRAVELPAAVHLAGEGVHRHVDGLPVPVGAGLAEVADRAQHDAGVDRGEVVVGEAEALLHRGGEVLHHDIGAEDEVVEDGPAGVGGEVESDRLLVGVEVEEEARFIGMGNVAGKGAVGAGGVAGPGAFDLEHVGAVVGEHLGAVGPSDVPGEVEDVETRDWLHRDEVPFGFRRA